jgi:DNA modification methylase
MTYREFLETKIETAPVSGFDVPPEEIHPALKPHQRDAVVWALHGGRRALFEAFGLGKTVQELEFCRQCLRRFGGKALIVMPLGVRQEFIHDAETLLEMEPPQYITRMAEAEAAPSGSILITNYERVRDGDVDPAGFACCVLDEAAVLRSFGSKTYQTFLPLFKGVKYKLVATATPAPNRLKELIHYAGFLEVMDTGQALTRFFQRDSTKANNLTLYPHKTDEFWTWVSTWALFISKPSDLGYSDEGYDLPPMEVRTHVIPDTYGQITDKDGQFKMLNDAATSLMEASREKRESIEARCAVAREIVEAEPEAHFLLWHDLEAERHELKRILPEVVDIYGSMDYAEREKRVTDFSFGRIRIFATKKSLSGCGCNFQRYCHRAIFVGVDYEFHDFIQAVHRIYRFLQSERVVIDILYTEAEEPIYRALMEKWKLHEEQQERMREIVSRYGLSGQAQIERLKRSIGVERVKIEGKRFTAVHADCVEETARMEDNSVDMILTSIPFSNHYEYTPSYNDFGHNEDTERFFQQMDFLSPSLLRVLRPGRVFACHVKDRVLFGNATGTGMPTMEPFHAICIQHYMSHGFQYFGMITVVTDVVRENNQTYRLGWTEQCKDGTKMGVGCPEYILLFRKLPTDTSTAYADEPVSKTKEEYTRAQWQLDAHGYWRSSGDRLLTKAELEKVPVDRLQAAYRKFSRETVYSYADHVALAKKLDADGHLPATFMVVAPGSWSPEVWDDVNRMRTLNAEQKRRDLQMHVCPLQFDIVDRLINRYSNPGELIFDPFGGIGTVPLRALKLGRRGLMTELNADYFRDAVGYLEAEEEEMDMPSLFDLMEDSV